MTEEKNSEKLIDFWEGDTDNNENGQFGNFPRRTTMPISTMPRRFISFSGTFMISGTNPLFYMIGS